jgi:pyruvate/2-oxoglutarate dehydrogenase complex dihydrolipoamide dehydrogenase (E3) component
MAEGAEQLAYPGANHDAAWRKLVYPANYENPAPQARYHLIVIGAGPAGLVIAIAAAGLGARVALIERQAMGGDCLNVGCVPSKALLEFTASQADSGSFDAAYSWLRSVRARIAEHDSVERYTAAGVDVFLGAARFADEATVSVGKDILNGRRIVIATGAHATLPPIPGLADCKPLTNETIFDLTARPKRLAVIGAGPIGCELSQALARMQIQVHLFEASNRVLGNDLPEAGAAVTAALRAVGVELHLSASIDKVERRGHNVIVTANGTETVADEVLVAAGRRANTDELNLAGVGVNTDKAGQIVVDRFLRTSNTRIFAAGDVCAKQQFTHTADAHARIVVQNALFLPTASTRKLVIPHCTYTHPEVASVGETRQTLAANNRDFAVYRVAFDDLDRGKAQGDMEGFVEVLAEPRNGKILGATIVGTDAGEQIAPLCLAMTHGIGLGALAKTVLPYPTRAEYLRRLGDAFNRNKLTARAKRLFATWFRWSLRS